MTIHLTVLELVTLLVQGWSNI